MKSGGQTGVPSVDSGSGGALWARIGTVLMVMGVLGLVLGTGPLVVVAFVDPKSTAVGPGLLMVVMLPPSVLVLALGVGLRKRAKWRTAGRLEMAMEAGRAWDRAA